MKLLAVYLGGRAPKANTELHDVVFAAGERIEDTYEHLMELWFGSVESLHVDSWVALEVIDGYRITLRQEPPVGSKKLYFINMGGYIPGLFTEAHENAFLIAESEQEVKKRAKRELLAGMQAVHTDDLYDVDDCIAVTEVGGWHVHLTHTGETQPFEPNNGYHIIPKKRVAAYLSRSDQGR